MASDTLAQHHKALCLAFQVLYGLSFADISDTKQLEKSYTDSLKTTQTKQVKIYGKLAWELVLGVYTHLKDIDGQIVRLTRDQKKDALTHIELTLLRLGIFELFFKREIAHKLVIEEIIALNRNFGAEESTSNISSVLEALSLAEHDEKILRHQSRLLAIQLLYALSFLKNADDDDLEAAYDNCLKAILDIDQTYTDKDEFAEAPFCLLCPKGDLTQRSDTPDLTSSETKPNFLFDSTHDLVFGVLRRLDEIDKQIKQFSQNWRFERIGHIELTLLRLAFFELFFINDIKPAPVQLDDIDEQINSLVDISTIKTMSVFALTLVRLASFEIFFRHETPTKVIIDEALELGTQFGASGAKKFINGILDAAKKDLDAKHSSQ